MRSSWVSTDLVVFLYLSDIMFWGIQGDNLEHARAIAYAWDAGRLEYPEGSCKVISAGTKY